MKTICILISVAIGACALFWWDLLPLPYSPPGRPISFFRGLTVIGYTYGFYFIGALVGGLIEGVFGLGQENKGNRDSDH